MIKTKHPDSYDGWKHLEALQGDEGLLEIVEFDIGIKEDWPDSLIEGVDCVYFCAAFNKFEILSLDYEVQEMFPTIEGIYRSMDLMKKHGVRRFIFTSCVCTVRGSKHRNLYNEEIWTPLENCESGERIKILAERTVWWIDQKFANTFDVTVLNPGLMLGPSMLQKVKGSSMQFFQKLISGETSV